MPYPEPPPSCTAPFDADVGEDVCPACGAELDEFGFCSDGCDVDDEFWEQS